MPGPRRNRSKADDPASQRTREKIRTTQLLNRLMAHGLNDKGKKGYVALSATQLKAVEILLKKTVPDLSAVDMTSGGEALQPVINISAAPVKPQKPNDGEG